MILAVGHMAHLFESFFQDGSRFGIKISYSYEDKPLGRKERFKNIKTYNQIFLRSSLRNAFK